MFFEDRSLAPYEGDEPYLFLSYSHKDSEKAGKIIRVLKKNGFRVWYDEGITPGAEWDDNVAQAIVDCSYFVALISPGYIASANCRDELNYARTLEKQRLLVYLEETELPPGIAMRVNQLLALHMDKYEEEDLFYERLFAAEGIDICRGNPAQEPVDAVPEETGEQREESPSEPETESEQEAPVGSEETAEKPADLPPESKQKPKKNRNLVILIPVVILIFLALILLPGKLKKPVSTVIPAVPSAGMQTETPAPTTELPAPPPETPTPTVKPTPTPRLRLPLPLLLYPPQHQPLHRNHGHRKSKPAWMRKSSMRTEKQGKRRWLSGSSAMRTAAVSCGAKQLFRNRLRPEAISRLV